jgi:hypothetical protein
MGRDIDLSDNTIYQKYAMYKMNSLCTLWISKTKIGTINSIPVASGGNHSFALYMTERGQGG